MAKHEHNRRTGKECRHFLVLTIRPGRDVVSFWARCTRCSRGWFLGTEDEIREMLERFEVAS